MPKVLQLISHSEAETAGLASKLAASFNDGDVIILTGELGTGKTVFVKALATALGVNAEEVNSPTYTFVNEYRGDKEIFHFDLYRLREPGDLFEIGWEDYLLRKGIVIVEWGEKAAYLLPAKYYLVEFKMMDEAQRSIDISVVEK
jgi:tRNA threonylcarbamoyladenosine biosynthesis protein TsaE